MKSMNPKWTHVAVGGLALSFLTGCLEMSALKEGESYSKFDMNRFSLNKVVCDPMGEDPEAPVELTQGLHAQLFYLEANQPRYQTVGQMISNGKKSSQNLFFSEVNVPTRLFDEGFPSESGGVVKDDQGQKLIEYFAVEFNGGLRLSDEDPEGEYELALLSDDGSIMSIADEEGNYSVVVNNDGDHETKFACGLKLNFTKDTQHKVKFRYYQGPKHHIAMVPMWRRVVPSLQAETNCGRAGNGVYFDYNNGSAQKQPYKDLLARGWRPISKANYVIPKEVGYNPCVEAEAPVISDLNVQPMVGGAVRVTWSTNIPATSQVRYLRTGVASSEQLTVSDNILRTSHSVTVYGLTSDTSYTAQAISISDDYGKGLSGEVQFTAF